MSRWFGSSAESVGKTSRAIVSVARRATGFQLATLAFESRFMFRIISLASTTHLCLVGLGFIVMLIKYAFVG